MQLVQADLFEYSPPSPFDAVYEQTCLCAIDPRRRPDFEQQVHSWLETGGQLILLAMQTGNSDEGPPFHCDLTDVRDLFSSSRWKWETGPPIRLDHPGGPIHELVCRLRRR